MLSEYPPGTTRKPSLPQPRWGWGPAAFTQGSLRRQPWAIVLNGVAVPDQQTCGRIGQTPVFASLREPVFFKPGFAP